MLLQRVNRSDPEKVFVVAKNSYSTASLTNGQAASWDYATDADGVGVTKPPARATCAGTSAAGVVAQTITAGSYGLIQTYGYHSAVRARTATGGSPGNDLGKHQQDHERDSQVGHERFESLRAHELTLRHGRYPTLFGVGIGSPRSGIAASV